MQMDIVIKMQTLITGVGKVITLEEGLGQWDAKRDKSSFTIKSKINTSNNCNLGPLFKIMDTLKKYGYKHQKEKLKWRD
jgi:hypothetical protein